MFDLNIAQIKHIIFNHLRLWVAIARHNLKHGGKFK